jgi:hypothetical protein
MKNQKDMILNIGFLESAVRMMLILPVGGFCACIVIMTHEYWLLLIPFYILATALIHYSPLKHLYMVVKHKPAYTENSDPIWAID